MSHTSDDPPTRPSPRPSRMGMAILATCMLVIGFAAGVALTDASAPVLEGESPAPTSGISSTDSPKSTTNVAEIVAKAREQLSFYGITDEDIYRDLLALRIFELLHREVDPLQTRPAGAAGVTQLGDPEVILQAGAGLCQHPAKGHVSAGVHRWRASQVPLGDETEKGGCRRASRKVPAAAVGPSGPGAREAGAAPASHAGGPRQGDEQLGRLARRGDRGAGPS